MHLSKIAAKRITEPLEAWDEVSETFVPEAFMGRVDLTDRFLSNFNKPLRRRMLFTTPGTQFPASRTFRHPGTQEVYLMGQSRGDAQSGDHYLDLTVCHLVTDVPNGSSGLATIYRKSPQGPAEDPGWLVEEQLGKAFIDLEFRTSASEPDTHEIQIENYYAFLPIHWNLKAWDFVELHGHRYRVVDTYSDSGMAGLRVDKQVDTRINFKLHTQGNRIYDPVNHKYVTAPTTFNVTGVMIKYHDFSNWRSDTEPYIDVSIEEEHIGVRPEPNTMFLEFEGRKRTITQVSTQPGERQYRLRCR